MKRSILVVDDDELLLGFIEEILLTAGYKVTAFSSPVKGLEFLKKETVDLVISDVKMNELTGDEVLAEVKKEYPNTGVILITGFGNINHAVRALHKGAFDYITKPFKAKEIIFRVNRFFESDPETEASKKKQTLASQKSAIKNDTSEAISPVDASDKGENQFVGNDPQIKKLMRVLPQIAKNVAPVLIQGESGTGKEVFAQQVHAHSNRANGPYIKINCANLPSELVESTLFGHIKGAFTGAISDRKGAFDAAEGGTLLLDEITEIEMNVQAKLLRVLQENEFYRVGSQKPIKSNVRILATSNRNIAEAIADKLFREDLYCRLNVFPIEIPPLRHRKSDIPLLVNYFAESYTNRYGLKHKEISKELMDYMIAQDWRGNVRELNNKMHRGIILAQDADKILVEHIDNELFSSADETLSNESISTTDLPLMSIEEMEMKLIKKALEQTQGNQKKAAQLLGISDRTIRNKLKQYGEGE